MSKMDEKQSRDPNGVTNGVTNGCNVLTPFHRFFFGRDLPFRAPCCDEHDLFYEQGGTRADRAFADRLFRECIREAGYPKSAWVCWLGVRLAGWLCWPGGCAGAEAGEPSGETGDIDSTTVNDYEKKEGGKVLQHPTTLWDTFPASFWFSQFLCPGWVASSRGNCIC